MLYIITGKKALTLILAKNYIDKNIVACFGFRK